MNLAWEEGEADSAMKPQGGPPAPFCPHISLLPSLPFIYSFFFLQLGVGNYVSLFLLVAEVTYLAPQPRGILPCLGKSQLHLRPLWRAGWSAANSVGISAASLLSRDLV